MQTTILLSYRRLRVSSLSLGAANCRFTTSSHYNDNAPLQLTEKPRLPRIELDASTMGLLGDLNMGMGTGSKSIRRKRPLIREDDETEGDEQKRTGWRPQRQEEDVDDERILDVMTEAEELRALDEAARVATGDLFDNGGPPNQQNGEDEDVGRRDERRSPAALLGSKRIGSVVLPEDLIAAIQKQVDTVDNPKLLRQAYLSAMSIRTSPKLPTSSTRKHKVAHQSLSLQAHASSPRDRDSSGFHANTRRKEAITPLTALLGAVVDLPGEFAAVRNVLGELKTRLGDKEWGRICGVDGDGDGENGGKWTIVDGGAGAGLWALQDTLRATHNVDDVLEYPSLQVVDIHGSRHILDLTRTLAEGADMVGDIEYKRLYQPSSDDKPTVLLAPFMLMKLPNQVARARKIREMWASGAETIILIDEGSPDGFRAIGDARSILLKLGASTPSDVEITSVSSVEEMLKKEKRRAKKQRRKDRVLAEEGVVEMIDGREVLRLGGEVYYAEGEEEGDEEVSIETTEEIVGRSEMPQKTTEEERKMVGSHVIAPCPHDGVCPLLSTRDTCHFSQRLQSPSFLRRTKHSKHGELDFNYSYVVIRRGPRPINDPTQKAVGLEGGVARDANEREALKRESERRGLIVPVKSGRGASSEVEGIPTDQAEAGMDGVEVMRYIPHPSQITSKAPVNEVALDEEELRKQAYAWPRLVHPPLKRSGHVIMDTCHPSGSIVRLTVPKTYSKQAYYDARKVSWGDIFPHPPKGTQVVRDRGVKKLNKYVHAVEEDAEGEEDEDKGLGRDLLVGEDEDEKRIGDVYVKTFG